MLSFELTPTEDRAYQSLIDLAREQAQPDANRTRKVYVEESATELATRLDIPIDIARKVVDSRCRGTLAQGDIIMFQSGTIVSVEDILLDPERYDREPCADPLEPEEGTSRAKFFANRDTGMPVINSMLHGGRVFHLQGSTLWKNAAYNADTALLRDDGWQPDHIARGHLFRDVEADGRRAIEMVIDGAIQAGLVFGAAATGVGKTSNFASLAARVAGLVPDCPLTPKIKRKVIYVTEDSHQVALILRAMVEAGVITDYESLRDRFKVLDATRMPPDTWAEIIASYSLYRLINTVNGVTIEADPLVVLDTKSAVFDLEEENSNTENSKAIAAIRQRTRCAIWIITHIAKSQRGQEASLLSARGADSQVADAQQLLTMSVDPFNPGARWLEIAGQKHRFLAAYDGISFELRTAECAVVDAFGQEVIETVAFGHPVPVLAGERDMARRQAEELSRDIKAMALRDDILKAVNQLAANGSITSKRAIHGITGGRRADVMRAIDDLADSGDLEAMNGAEAGVSGAKKGQVVYLRPDGLPVPDQARDHS